MKRKLAIILIFISHLCFLNAQMSLVVNKLYISHYDVKYIEGKDYEDDEDGPHIGADCVLKNNSKSDTIEISPSDSQVYFEFRYKGNIYNQAVSSLSFREKDEVLLSPQNSYSFSFGMPILLGTLFIRSKKQNYTKEIMEILPTIKVVYKQKKMKLISEEIMSVNVGD